MSRGVSIRFKLAENTNLHSVSRGSYQYQQRISTSPDCCHLDILLTIEFSMIY